MKWVGDITYVPTWQGFAYLAVVMDCFSKKIVGHAIAGHMRTELVTEALAMAVRNCPPTRGVTIFHSNRGSQYTSAEYTKFMTDHGILPSVGRTGSCFDNAAAESFNAILKKELVNRKVYPTRNHAIRDVTAWIELRYNHKRLHSAIDYRTPNQVDTEWRQQHRAAA
ncbi:Integrase core domain [Propionibacterium australiense]|nr:Integrase core domain [Propionibacterium australiense]